MPGASGCELWEILGCSPTGLFMPSGSWSALDVLRDPVPSVEICCFCLPSPDPENDDSSPGGTHRIRSLALDGHVTSQ